MHGICGWTGWVAGFAGDDSVLPCMAAGCLGGAPARSTVLRGAGVGFATLGGKGEDCLFSDQDLAVALSETPTGASGRVLSARDLAELYRTHGEDFLRRVRGAFALALYDWREGKLVLAVDRAGVRPLYVWPRGEVIAFASRLDGLRPVPGFGAELDPQALFDYLYCHVVPSPGTIYKGCLKLLPAQMLCFQGGRRRGHFYWAMPYRDDNPAPFDRLREELRALLPQVVDRAASGNGTVGAFLSGDTDSATVAGTLRQTLGRPTRTYSIGFRAEGDDAMGYARIAARHFGTEAREYCVTPDDVIQGIPRVAAYCDEPFGNASVVPAYLCARFARGDGIERLLAGDGCDQIFGGNARYANHWVFELYGRIPPALRNRLIEPVVQRFPAGQRLSPVRKAQGYLAQAKVPLPDRLGTDNVLHRSPLAESFVPDFLSAVDPEHPLSDLREVYGRTRSRSSTNRMMHLDLKVTLADNDLRKINQACGLAGVDVRFPLLDDELLELAARVPPEMQVHRTQLRWFFNKALADFLPPEIIAKHKHGFGLPVGLWMAEHPDLRALTHESLGAFRRRDILNPTWLDRLERQHNQAHATYSGVMLWVVVMLEQWLQRHGH